MTVIAQTYPSDDSMTELNPVEFDDPTVTSE